MSSTTSPSPASSAKDQPAPTMPYNTRRKSLSLPSLGIHVPVTHAARTAAHRSTPSARATSPTDATEHPPTKKMKRSHSEASSTPMSPARRESSKNRIQYETTPPPSPEAEERGDLKIDLGAIHDEIVEAVLIQLQKTGNRPHLVKELAAILSRSVKIVESSANPAAIISSRLSSFLKRPCWSAQAPCPLAKELETVHPRRTYFYLSDRPHQPLPDPAQAAAISDALRLPQRSIISPSLSSAASRSDDTEERRRELSPSPEVDLSSPEFDDVDDDAVSFPITPIGSFSSSRSRHAHDLVRNHRSASPPLEKDEREFTQAARGMQRRKLTSNTDMPLHAPSERVSEIDDAADALFGRFGGAAHYAFVSSPVVRPFPSSASKRSFDESSMSDVWTRMDGSLELDLRSPEHIALEELDGMFDDF